MNATAYICTLPASERQRIRAALLEAGASGEDLELAMNSRLCDITDALNNR